MKPLLVLVALLMLSASLASAQILPVSVRKGYSTADSTVVKTTWRIKAAKLTNQTTHFTISNRDTKNAIKFCFQASDTATTTHFVFPGYDYNMWITDSDSLFYKAVVDSASNYVELDQ